MKTWINFVELRKQLDFADVLKHYNVGLEPKGEAGQHVGKCPLPNHPDAKGKSFSANFEKGVWQCFGCHESGNVIDFAVLMAGKNKKDGKDVRETAVFLRDRFVQTPEVRRPPATSEQKPAGEAKPLKEGVVNQPLDFALKTLEGDHPYFHDHGLTAETVSRFGLGYCKRGSLTGRIAVPLLDDAEQLVGYSGLILDEAKVSEGNPRYIFPTEREVEGVLHMFKKGRFLYNGFRLGKAVKDLLVVRECHTVWHLYQGGFVNVVALMGDECSREQAATFPMLTADGARIWLLTDSSEESENAGRCFLPQVASSRLCRWVKVDREEEIAPDHPLLRALPKR